MRLGTALSVTSAKGISKDVYETWSRRYKVCPQRLPDLTYSSPGKSVVNGTRGSAVTLTADTRMCVANVEGRTQQSVANDAAGRAPKISQPRGAHAGMLEGHEQQKVLRDYIVFRDWI